MPRIKDQATANAKSVISGKQIAGRLVRLACERHLRDLEEGPARGLKWDLAAAARVIEFFSYLRLAEGEFEGKPFILQPFQTFIVGNIFGWKGPDGFRRFRTAYVEVSKGSGKSPLAGGIGIYGLVADGEAAAEIYAAATMLKQAAILFRDARNMIEATPALKSKLDVGLHNIAHHPSQSFFRPVSSERRGLDGPRVHMALIDELHEHPNASVVDKLRAGTKGRRQALIFEITNSGVDRESICFQHHAYSSQILERLAEDDSWFAFVCNLDPCEPCRAEGHFQPADGCPNCDDWRDEKVWVKANPGIDTILPAKYLREQVREAKGMPSKEDIVKRLNFCIWTQAVTRWLNMDRWDQAGEPFDPEILKGRECYGALDLASTTDTASLALLFPDVFEITTPEGTRGVYALLSFFWVPENACKERERRNKARLDGWVKEGMIDATPGDVIDFERIRRRITGIYFEGGQQRQDPDCLGNLYNIRQLAIDRWNATQLATQLQGDGAIGEIEAFGQGFASMSAPTKEFESLILSGRIRHGGNKVLRWMAGNVSVEQDAAGNVKPTKEKSPEKIDGIVAAIMALGLGMKRPASSPGITWL